MLLLLLWSCHTASEESGDHWVVRGPEVLGEVVLGEDCRVAVWGGEWSSPGAELVSCALEESDGWSWLHFPMVMGAGEGQGVLGVSADRQRAQLPLGVREGEHLLRMDLQPGSLDPAERRAAWESSERQIALLEEAWKLGVFQIFHGDTLVGDFHFQDSGTASIALYDPFWMTDGRSTAVLIEEGPDLVFAFSAMPSFQGEPAVLRVNRPTAKAVAPMGDVPTAADRRFQLVPGSVEPGARDAAVALALQRGGEREKSVMVPLFQDLASSLAEQAPPCPPTPGLEVGSLLLVGYELRSTAVGSGCGLTVDPSPIQHGRRLSLRILPGQEVETWLRDFEPGSF